MWQLEHNMYKEKKERHRLINHSYIYISFFIVFNVNICIIHRRGTTQKPGNKCLYSFKLGAIT